MVLDANPLASFEAIRLRVARMRMRGGVGLKDLVAAVATDMATVLGVARIGVWFFVDDRRRLSIFHLHDSDSTASYEGTFLEKDDFPVYFRALSEGKALRIDDIGTDPRAAEFREVYLQPLGIGALLDVPILRDGQVVGVVCHEHRGTARHWSDVETGLAMAAADSIALGLAEAERSEAETTLAAMRSHQEETKNLALLGKMAAGIAHDLNNILTIVAGNAELLAEVGTPTPDARAIIAEIQRSAGRGKALARDLMELDRTRKSSPRLVTIGSHLENFARGLARGLGRTHVVTCEVEGVGRALIDPRQLERVIMNLVVNACDAMVNGGKVSLRVSDVSLIDGATAGSWVRVDVVDEGHGMDEESVRKLFEPFFSTKVDGKGGLGMTIVKDLVSRAGGFIHVESEVARGTTVRLYLPRVA
jgi:signal transduction histidine kinase